MSQRTLLFTSTRGAYRPLVYQGTLIHQTHQQLMRLVGEQLGAEHVALFAEPVADPSQEAIDWYSRTEGEAVRLDQAPEPQRRLAETKLAGLVGDLEAFTRELGASPDQNRRAAGKMLELALQHPDASSLFLVGEQPVLAGWGTAPASSDLDPESLSRFRDLISPEERDDLVRDKAVPLTPPAPPTPPLPPAAPAPTPPPPPPPAGKGCAWWLLRALLLALALGLLLLALAWLLPPGCSPLAGLPGGGLPGLNLPGGFGGGTGGSGGNGAGGGNGAETLAPRLEQSQGREADLRAELERLRVELEQRRQACLARKAVPPEPVPEPLPAPSAEQPAVPDKPAVVPTKPVAPPRTTPPTTTTLPKREPARPTPKPEQPLTVTKEDQENKDVSFLKGRWQSVTNVVEEGTNRPVVIELEIDDQGRGTSTIVRENGQRCPAPMRSYFNDQGNLVFEDSQMHPCPDGSKFQPSQVVCQVGPDGRATCKGRHPNGHTYDVIIKRR